MLVEKDITTDVREMLLQDKTVDQVKTYIVKQNQSAFAADKVIRKVKNEIRDEIHTRIKDLLQQGLKLEDFKNEFDDIPKNVYNENVETFKKKYLMKLNAAIIKELNNGTDAELICQMYKVNILSEYELSELVIELQKKHVAKLKKNKQKKILTGVGIVILSLVFLFIKSYLVSNPSEYQEFLMRKGKHLKGFIFAIGLLISGAGTFFYGLSAKIPEIIQNKFNKTAPYYQKLLK